MELTKLALLNGLFFEVGKSYVKRIFMFNSDTLLTLVTMDDGEVINVPFHAVMYWV
jgi:hypothetical protein